MSNLVIAVVGNKGGIGKTTLSYNLLYCLKKAGVSAVLIDCDNDQYSSADFAEDRKNAKIEPELNVNNLPTEKLEKDILYHIVKNGSFEDVSYKIPVGKKQESKAKNGCWDIIEKV